jgi:hypothetical protein
MKIIDIDTTKITNWESFHSYFKEKFYFPDYYGNNMNAWIDCMTYIDDPDGIFSVKASLAINDFIVLNILSAGDFMNKLPEIYNALVECSSFVNYRRIEDGDSALLFLSFYKN